MSLFSLAALGAYILTVRVGRILSSTFPVKWESVSAQSYDCRTVVVVPYVVRLVCTWLKVGSVTSH